MDREEEKEHSRQSGDGIRKDLEMNAVCDSIQEIGMLWSEVSCLYVKVLKFGKMEGFES